MTALFDEAKGLVTYVTDGDTIAVDGVGVVRLADIDSPELASSGGPEAKEYTRMPLGQEISPENEIWFSSSVDAKMKGYVPCEVCHPM